MSTHTNHITTDLLQHHPILAHAAPTAAATRLLVLLLHQAVVVRGGEAELCGCGCGSVGVASVSKSYSYTHGGRESTYTPEHHHHPITLVLAHLEQKLLAELYLVLVLGHPLQLPRLQQPPAPVTAAAVACFGLV